jgi:serine-type D-Ala-D-Ala carboxypeptidase (penicillin-binding protein 5/6)
MSLFAGIGSLLTGLAVVALSAGPFSLSDPLRENLDTSQIITPTKVTAPALPVSDGVAPPVAAPAAAVLDRETGALLWSRESETPRAMASLTKLMTAVVALERSDPSRVLEVRAEDLGGDPAESRMGLIPGARLSLIELLHGLLISSGNDAAQVISREVGGDREAFVGWMNEKAGALGLDETRFANPTGLDAPGHQSSVRDLAVLADYALRYPLIKQVTQTAHHTARDSAGRPYALTSTNQLTLSGEARGVKTGRTPAAGECLIALEEVGGREILSVVLASPDRFAETKTLFSWTRDHVRWH